MFNVSVIHVCSLSNTVRQDLRIPFPGHHRPVVGLHGPVVERVGQVELVDLLLVLHPGQRHIHAANGGCWGGGNGRLGGRGGRGSVRGDVAAVGEPPAKLRKRTTLEEFALREIHLYPNTFIGQEWPPVGTTRDQLQPP